MCAIRQTVEDFGKCCRFMEFPEQRFDRQGPAGEPGRRVEQEPTEARRRAAEVSAGGQYLRPDNRGLDRPCLRQRDERPIGLIQCVRA